ncbi:MAG: hypothetical protein ACRDBG_10915 [Waterburya sp.]
MPNPYLKVSVSAFKSALSLIPTPLASQSGNVAGYRLISDAANLTIMSYNLTASGSAYVQDVEGTEFDIVIPASLIKILTFGSKDLHLEIVGNQLINKNNKNKIALINTEDWLEDIEVKGSPVFLGSLVDSLGVAATFACAEREVLKKIKISPNSLIATNGHVAFALETPTEVTEEKYLTTEAVPYLNKQCDVVFGADGNIKITTADSDVVVFGANAGSYPPVESLFPTSYKFTAQVNAEKALAILALIKGVDANSAVDIINQDNRLCISFSNGIVDVLEDVGVEDLEEWETISFSTKYLAQVLAGSEIKTLKQNSPTTPAIFESEGTRILVMPIMKR